MDVINAILGRNPEPNSLTMGDVLSLWDVARNKIIGLSTLSIYYFQAKDKDLKHLIEIGIEHILVKHVNKIQKLMEKKGYEFPSFMNWEKKLDKDTKLSIPDNIINDEEIAISLREIIRLTLSLETEGLRNSIDKDTRELLTEILDDDNTAYSSVLSLQNKKNWRDYPPIIYSH